MSATPPWVAGRPLAVMSARVAHPPAGGSLDRRPATWPCHKERIALQHQERHGALCQRVNRGT